MIFATLDRLWNGLHWHLTKIIQRRGFSRIQRIQITKWRFTAGALIGLDCCRRSNKPPTLASGIPSRMQCPIYRISTVYLQYIYSILLLDSSMYRVCREQSFFIHVYDSLCAAITRAHDAHVHIMQYQRPEALTKIKQSNQSKAILVDSGWLRLQILW